MKKYALITLCSLAISFSSFAQTKSLLISAGFGLDDATNEIVSSFQFPTFGLAFRMTSEYGHFHEIGFQQLWYKKTNTPMNYTQEFQGAFQYTYAQSILDMKGHTSLLIGGWGALKYQRSNFEPFYSNDFPENFWETGLDFGAYLELRKEIGKNLLLTLSSPINIGSHRYREVIMHEPGRTAAQNTNAGWDFSFSLFKELEIYLGLGWRFN